MVAIKKVVGRCWTPKKHLCRLSHTYYGVSIFRTQEYDKISKVAVYIERMLYTILTAQFLTYFPPISDLGILHLEWNHLKFFISNDLWTASSRVLLSLWLPNCNDVDYFNNISMA